MTEARQMVAWDHTAMIVAKIHNLVCAKAKDLIRDPSVLNPYRPRKPQARVPLKALRAAMEGVQVGGTN